MPKRIRRNSKTLNDSTSAFFQKFISQRNVKTKLKSASRKIGETIDKKPLTSFFIVLGILLLLIVVGSLIRKPQSMPPTTIATKLVDTYSIGKAPTVKVQAKIEKSGIIKIVAQSPGIVNFINVVEGQEVEKGATLVGLSNNYLGGNAASVSREIAQLTSKNVKDSYDIQKEIIKKQRDLTDKADQNADQLRDIASKSIDETKSLLELNQSIVSTLTTSLSALESNNQSGSNDSQILQTKQIISQYQAAVNQLQVGVRNSEYQAAGDRPVAEISNLTKDIALKQLDLQEKALSLSIETSSLSLKLAQIQESAMYPAAPFKGVIERVYVTQGASVMPGTPLLIIHGAQTLKAVAFVPKEIAQEISTVDSATTYIMNKKYKTSPYYISSDATDGSNYSVFFDIPKDFQNYIANNEFITIEIPVGHAQTSSSIPFIPIDAVFKSSEASYVFILKNGKATTRKVEVGPILGQYAQINSGLKSGDVIILSRNILNGDNVKSAN